MFFQFFSARARARKQTLSCFSLFFLWRPTQYLRCPCVHTADGRERAKESPEKINKYWWGARVVWIARKTRARAESTAAAAHSYARHGHSLSLSRGQSDVIDFRYRPRYIYTPPARRPSNEIISLRACGCVHIAVLERSSNYIYVLREIDISCRTTHTTILSRNIVSVCAPLSRSRNVFGKLDESERI